MSEEANLKAPDLVVTVPDISRVVAPLDISVGVLVPIPTLPEELIRILSKFSPSAPEVPNESPMFLAYTSSDTVLTDVLTEGDNPPEVSFEKVSKELKTSPNDGLD